MRVLPVAILTSALVGAALLGPSALSAVQSAAGPPDRSTAREGSPLSSGPATLVAAPGPTPRSCVEGSVPKLDVDFDALAKAAPAASVDLAVRQVVPKNRVASAVLEPMGSLAIAPVWVDAGGATYLVQTDGTRSGWTIAPATFLGCVKFGSERSAS